MMSRHALLLLVLHIYTAYANPCGPPDSPGPHSAECLAFLWRNIGCKPEGTSGPAHSSSNVAWWNSMSVQEVRLDMKLYSTFSVRNKKNNAGVSFRSMCKGNTDNDTKRGPYTLDFLTRLWEEAGCLPGGTGSPRNEPMSVRWWNGQSVAEVRKDMGSYKQFADEGKKTSAGISYHKICYGAAKKEDCGNDNNKGPHTTECLLQLWLQTGCTEVGLASPVHKRYFQKWYAQRLKEVRESMKRYRKRADRGMRTRKGATYLELCYGPNLNGTCGVSGVIKSDITMKIFGGRTVTQPQKWPWMVSIQSVYGNRHFCGGAVIHPKWILTASHCVTPIKDNPSDARVVAGGVDLGKPEERGRQIRKIKLPLDHPEYVLRRHPVFYVVNDIALIELDEPLELTGDVRAVCMPDAADTNFTNCHVVGWGRQKRTGMTGGKLQETEAAPVPRSECIKEWPNYKSMIQEGRQTCVTGSSKSVVCRGDSGGPLLCQQGARNWVVAGVASWAGGNCQGTQKPFAYADVAKFLGWIKSSCGCI